MEREKERMPGGETIDTDSLEVEEVYETESAGGGNVLRLLAQGLSVAAHPLLVPSLLFAIVLFSSPRLSAPLQPDLRWPMLGLLVLTTFLIPVGSLLILYTLGRIPSLHMPERKQRGLPFLFVSIFYAVTSYIFISKYPQLLHLNIMLAGITFIIFLITAVTLYWKISAHSTAISGGVGFLAAFAVFYQDSVLLYVLAGMIVLAGAVMSARLYLNAHEPAEVWVGGLLGLLISMASVFFFLLL